MSTFVPPLQVSILRSASIILNPSTELDVTLQFRGFIHPLLGAPPPAPPPQETVAMWARIQKFHFTVKMGAGPNSVQLVRGQYSLMLCGFNSTFSTNHISM